LLAGGDVLTHLLGRTLISWAIGRHMLHLTEEMLVIAKQPQKLLNEYQVPAAVVADMIRKAMVQIGEEGALFPGGLFLRLEGIT
jgi:hypothetical protein